MDSNLTLIKNEFEKRKGEFVLESFNNAVRLVNIAEDEHDYYYVYFDGRKYTYHSCVGGFYST